MKYTIEFELPDNQTIEDESEECYVSWAGWGRAGVAKAKPVEEPKKGKWEDMVKLDSDGYPFKVGVYCSACGFGTLHEDNYCPCCGAEMEVSK